MYFLPWFCSLTLSSYFNLNTLYIFSCYFSFSVRLHFLINSSNSYNKSCWYGLFSYLLCTIRMTWKKIPNMFFCWLVLWNKVKISSYITWVYAALWTNEMVHNVYFLVRSHSLYNMEMQSELSRRKKPKISLFWTQFNKLYILWFRI